MELRRFFNIKSIAAVFTGALLGFGYYYFVGCKSGSCPITGSPYISTLYGGFIGLIFTLPSKKKKDEEHAGDK
jgi:hypothetical protein